MVDFPDVPREAAGDGGGAVKCGTGDLFASESAEPPKASPSGPTADEVEHVDLVPTFLGVLAIPGVGRKTLAAMHSLGVLRQLAKSQTVTEQREVLRAHREDLHLKEPVAEALGSLKALLAETGIESKNAFAKNGIEVVLRGDPDYPSRLERMPQPPEWLFIQGLPETVKSNALVAVIGSRDASEEGLELAEKTGAALAMRSAGVVSGLARGIDLSAHHGALRFYGATVAVLGQGLTSRLSHEQDVIWDYIMEMEGAVVSEYLPNERPSRHNLLRRNEVVAALAQVVLPIECPSGSTGTAATIRRALSIGTPVAGLAAKQDTNQRLRDTEVYLRSQDIPIFALENGRYEKLLSLLADRIPADDRDKERRNREARIALRLASSFSHQTSQLKLTEDEQRRVLGRMQAMIIGEPQ